MKFALSESGTKIEPSKGIKGICPICKEPLIAKCGKIKVHHWAHKSGTECDPWSSPETPWHRNWKNCFPKEWQEVLCEVEGSTEIHRADVKTSDDLVLEFQHSPIEDEEKLKRESFYQNMFWIVDLHKKQWVNKLSTARFANDYFGNHCCVNAQEIFPSEWLNRNVFVIFDYKGTTSEKSTLDDLICIVPTIEKKQFSYIYPLNREFFIKGVTDNSVVIELRNYQKKINDLLLGLQNLSKLSSSRNTYSVYQQNKLSGYRRLNRRQKRF